MGHGPHLRYIRGRKPEEEGGKAAEWARGNSGMGSDSRPARKPSSASTRAFLDCDRRRESCGPERGGAAAALRGISIHQLLERLPAVDPPGRQGAADRWLERSAGVADASLRAEIIQQVRGILADSRFSALFGEGSLGEAPLAATLADGRVIAGTVDRLLVEEQRILVIDFKTGRVPAREADIPNAHRAQMNAYTDALRVIFPGREVRAALLYTLGPKLIEVMA